jgi:hypothetical protein
MSAAVDEIVRVRAARDRAGRQNPRHAAAAGGGLMSNAGADELIADLDRMIATRA